MAAKLRETVRKVLATEGMTQDKLAVRLYGSAAQQGKISGMLSAADDSTWEKHWQVILKLVKLGEELGINPYDNPARKLNMAQTEKEVLAHVATSAREATSRAAGAGSGRDKTKDARAIPARGNAKHQRNTR